jgi:hypothetical protein
MTPPAAASPLEAGPIDPPSSTDTPQDADSLQRFLSVQLPVSGVTFAPDEMVYQQQAFEWMIGQVDYWKDISENRILQRYALASIYYATNSVANELTAGLGSTDSAVVDSWDSVGEGDAEWLAASDECLWFGIYDCNSDGLVMIFDMFDNMLTGSIPPEMGVLKELVYLRFEFNWVVNIGESGHAFLGYLPKLRDLYYNDNGMHDTKGIPAVIGELEHLEYFDCSYNFYFGALSTDVVGRMTAVVELLIGGNYFNGPFPRVSLPYVEYLYADNSDLTGDLDWIPAMPSLYALDLRGNGDLAGTIPDTISSLQSIHYLDLSQCDIEGRIPTSMGLLTTLAHLYLDDNSLTGGIPASLSWCEELEDLRLDGNDLEGAMPGVICDLQTEAALTLLGADCTEADPQVPCECCTCCGDECKAHNRVRRDRRLRRESRRRY